MQKETENDAWCGKRLTPSDKYSVETVPILEKLLAQSILLRDLYKTVRRQPFDHRMHLLFGGHYKEQLRLVDVLIDRLRMLGGAGRLLAADFLNSPQPYCGVRGRTELNRCIDELLDAHELVLNTAQPTGATDNQQWVREFAVGLVVLTNDLQRVSLSEQWLRQTHQRCGPTLPNRG